MQVVQRDEHRRRSRERFERVYGPIDEQRTQLGLGFEGRHARRVAGRGTACAIEGLGEGTGQARVDQRTERAALPQRVAAPDERVETTVPRPRDQLGEEHRLPDPGFTLDAQQRTPTGAHTGDPAVGEPDFGTAPEEHGENLGEFTDDAERAHPYIRPVSPDPTPEERADDVLRRVAARVSDVLVPPSGPGAESAGTDAAGAGVTEPEATNTETETDTGHDGGDAQ